MDDVTVELALVVDGHVGRATTNARRRRPGRLRPASAPRPPPRRPRWRRRLSRAFPTPAPGRAHEGHDPPPPRSSPAAAERRCARRSAWPSRPGSRPTASGRRARSSAPCHQRRWRGGDRTTDAYMKVICIRAADGRSGFDARARRGGRGIDPQRRGRARRRQGVAPGRAGRARARRAPGGLRGPRGGELCDLLGVTALNGLAHAEDRGALSGRLGQAVAAPSINLSDSPRMPGTAPARLRRRGRAQGARCR